MKLGGFTPRMNHNQSQGSALQQVNFLAKRLKCLGRLWDSVRILPVGYIQKRYKYNLTVLRIITGEGKRRTKTPQHIISNQFHALAYTPVAAITKISKMYSVL